MHLDTIPLEPDSTYKATGRMSIKDGASMQVQNIQITTDSVGCVQTYSDGMPGSNAEIADAWDYLKLTNVQTGKIWDLRLHTAALNGSAKMAKEAIDEGADVRLRMKQESTAATINGQTVSFSAEPTDSDEQLIEAAEEGDLEAVKSTLAAGADINCLSSDGWSPLLSAVKHDPQIVELLLVKGADPNLASEHGYTPLLRAAGLGKIQAVKLLLAAGADKNMRDCNGKTAGQLAMESGKMRCALMVQ